VTGTELYRLKAADRGRASSVLFEAFLHDPFFAYLLGPRCTDERVATSFHRFTINVGLRYGVVQAPSAGIEGVAIWLPPGHTAITVWNAIMSGVLGIKGATVRHVKDVIRFVSRMVAYSSYAATLHEKHAPMPHWYLMVIGIGDAYRGMGYASRLLRPMLAQCDSKRLPCYLETHNPTNVDLYRHFGFSVMEAGTLPGSDTRQWAMLRKPEA